MKLVLKSLFVVGVLGFGTMALTGCGAKGGFDGANAEYGSTDGNGANGTGIGLGTLQRVYFEYDRAEIAGEAAKTLKKNASEIKKNANMRVLIEGHCDERGTNEYNIALGERRAKATMDYLVSLGIGRDRLETKSWGEEKPLDGGHAEDSWKKNRRAEFIVLAK